jgi:hypothetical protein
VRLRWLCAALLLLVTVPAQARSAVVLSYPLGEIWSTAVRFIRVDRGYVVKEKDPASGYVLFELVESGKTYKGALELVSTTDDDGRDATRASFALPDLPRHYETMLLDKLGAKIREERGTPPPAPPRKPSGERPAPDAGAPGALPRPPMYKELPR